ncbi:MAG: FkbM family methyltransferase [Xanthomonadaceae bacterium]|jgi:FkbM family methyltransferase|nr:FkbM family methyltransferase [Xanthomonadaceae bacterium]
MSGLRARLAAALRDRLGVPGIGGSLRRLKRRGLQAACVFDVGAHDGDFTALALATWPDACVHCFEPLPDKRQPLLARFAHRAVAVHGDLLGATSGEAVTLSCVGTASSVLREHAGPVGEPLALSTRALDDLVAAGALPSSCDLLKIDVQGYELAVLRGAQRLLERTRVLLLEVNLLDIHVGLPLLHEVTAWLAERGFVADDLAGITRRPLDDALWQVDLVFARPDAAWRADKRWGG